MPRNPFNNPTERIGRLLEDIEALEHYSQHLFDLLSDDAIKSVPAYPILEQTISERAIRSRFLGQTLANRSAQRRSRERLSGGARIRNHEPYSPSQDQAISEEISTTIVDTQSFPNIDPSAISDVAGVSEELKEKLEKLMKEGEGNA